MDMGTRIRNLRENAGLTQLALAKILKIRNSTLSQYESGDRTPSDDVKTAIADFFEVSVDYLLGRENAEKKPTPVSGDGLSEEQVELLRHFQRASPALRAAALAVLKSDGEQGKALGESSSGE